jgi:hypothetical protein
VVLCPYQRQFPWDVAAKRTLCMGILRCCIIMVVLKCSLINTADIWNHQLDMRQTLPYIKVVYIMNYGWCFFSPVPGGVLKKRTWTG